MFNFCFMISHKSNDISPQPSDKIWPSSLIMSGLNSTFTVPKSIKVDVLKSKPILD